LPAHLFGKIDSFLLFLGKLQEKMLFWAKMQEKKLLFWFKTARKNLFFQTNLLFFHMSLIISSELSVQ